MYQDFLRKFFLTVPNHIIEEPFSAEFQKISGSENFMDKKRGGSIKIFRPKFLVSQCRKNS